MRASLKLAAISTLLGCALSNQAFAGWWTVPEFDGAGATAAFALLAAVGAIMFGRSRSR